MGFFFYNKSKKTVSLWKYVMHFFLIVLAAGRLSFGCEHQQGKKKERARSMVVF